jgi:uncharacterized protein YgiM (DUF1202 family)
MWIDSSGQVHRDINTNSSNTRNVQPNSQPGRAYQNTTNDSGSKIWIIVIVCVIAFIIIISQCGRSNQSRDTNRSQDTTIQPEVATVKSDALNVRAGPSADDRGIDKIYRTNRVEIIEKYNNGWVKINYNNGKTGYVNGEYLLR